MKDRIIQFLSAEHISPAEFADKIGVQRSSMSHILNGRNYPSASFLQKMLQVYPLVNPRWLMIGEGQMNAEFSGATGNHIQTSAKSLAQSVIPPSIEDDNAFPGDKPPFQDQSPINELRSKPMLDQPNTHIESSKHLSPEQLNPKDFQESKTTTENKLSDAMAGPNETFPASIPLDKDIEKILFFFTDKTFALYRPS